MVTSIDYHFVGQRIRNHVITQFTSKTTIGFNKKFIFSPRGDARIASLCHRLYSIQIQVCHHWYKTSKLHRTSYRFT